MITSQQLNILQHSLGCDQFGRSKHRGRDEGDGCFGFYRNRYVTDANQKDGLECQALVALGFMIDHGPQSIAGGMHCYAVTERGLEAMICESPRPPKLTRSQERFQRYRECADCFENFRAFLRYEAHEKAHR